MITINSSPVRFSDGRFVPAEAPQGREGTMAHAILMAHSTSGSAERLSISEQFIARFGICPRAVSTRIVGI